MSQYDNATSHQTVDGQKAAVNGQGQAGEQMEATPPSSVNATAADNSIEIGVAGGGGPQANGADHGHHDYKGPKIWRIIVKHWPFISQPLALVAIAVGLWVIAYVLLPDYALPNTPIMRICFLFVGAQLSGVLVTFLRLPDMLGMLFFGVIYTNVGLADFTGYDKFEAFLREMALINIMLLAGLGLDANAFKKLWLMILRLTLVPTIAEVAIITVIARFTLGMPWFWGILLGWRIIVKHWPFISQPLALVAIAVGLWVIAYVLLPDYALPNTPIMRICFLFVGAQLSGVLVTFLRLPDMLGMLFFGVIYTNVGLADFTGYDKFEAFLREMALINIMLLAGLGLDANAFKKLWLMILRLTLVPTIAEVAIITVIARFTLGMPWFWGILLGLVITAVSPNVVVTVMLKLREERLGLNSGIHTLIYAMTSCNDVVAIFLFGVFMSVIFSTDKSLTEQILQGPIGIGIGIVFGYVYGLMLTILPSTKTPYLNGLRFVLTILGGTISVMGSRAIGYPSAGALGCMTIAFFAGLGWKRQQRQWTAQQRQRQLENENATVPARLDLLWKFLKPVSFSLIGKEINFAVLDGRVVGYGALLVLLGSLFRLGFAYLSTYGGDLTRKERAYITISGFSKATVQAALGPLALDMARSLKPLDEQSVALANNVLIISVLAIIFTAPLGAVLMLRLAPLWLQHSDVSGGGGGDGSSNNNDGNVNEKEYKKKRLSNGSILGDTLNFTPPVARSLKTSRIKIQQYSSSNSLNTMAAVDELGAVGKEARVDVDATSAARTPLPQARAKAPHHLV
ncbi:sodium/hydrogen exchanger 9B2 isoform X2 [Zeugodacus cucurbitae]|nr:sodium/hydrogen exchanger 9B2 isoform X2 [Zeugodacus cucurbitae]